MTGKLQQQEKKQLAAWIGGRKKFTLLYSACRYGCSAEIFHEKCDYQGPTVTVLYNTDQTTFGGYTMISWNDKSNCHNDENAFLFRLQYNGSPKPTKFHRNGEGNDVYCKKSYGPTFGGGYDLFTFSGTINQHGNNFPLNGYIKPGKSYNMQGDDAKSFANDNLKVIDLEVYQVNEAFPDEAEEKPWRATPIMDTKLMLKLKEYVGNYKPLEELKVQYVKILLVGQIGSGKSSFFNTVNSIFRGYVTSQACSGSSKHSLTNEFRIYAVRQSDGKKLNFRLCDTRGLEEDKGLDGVDMLHLLEGNIPDHYKFHPTSPISPRSPGFISSTKLGDQIHCVAFVVDASTVDALPEKVVKRMRDLQLQMNDKGVPQVVLMTKIDQICEPLSRDLSKVFYIPTIQEHVDKVAHVMSLPRSHILPVKNYESETELNENIDTLSLLAMQRILNFANDFLLNFLD